MKQLLFLSQIPKISIDIPKLTATQILAGALNITYFIVFSVAIIVIVLSGYTFVTSVYDTQKVAKAKNAILYAVIGIVISLVAFAVTQFVFNKFSDLS